MSSAPAPETTASESAAFHHRGEDDLRHLAASAIAIRYSDRRQHVSTGRGETARVAGAMSKLRHLCRLRPLLLACTLLGFANVAVAQDRGAAQGHPTPRSP